MWDRLAPYVWLMRLTFLKLMAYRMRYVTGIATYGIFVGGQYAIWRAVFAAKGLTADQELNGLTLPQLATYLAVGYIARAAYFTNTDSEIAGGTLPTKPTRKILVPMKTSTNANAYFKYLNRWIIAASAKYSARRPRIAKMSLV